MALLNEIVEMRGAGLMWSNGEFYLGHVRNGDAHGTSKQRGLLSSCIHKALRWARDKDECHRTRGGP